jgi:hypothetical protein
LILGRNPSSLSEPVSSWRQIKMVNKIPCCFWVGVVGWCGVLLLVGFWECIACTLEVEAVVCGHADDKGEKNLDTSSPSATSFPSPSSLPFCASTERTLG